MNRLHTRLSCLLVTGLAACLPSSIQAAPLVFDNTSARQAAQELSDKYGVNIVFKGDFGAPKTVTFTLADADADGARLEAVNALANALGADFTKTFVISKASGDASGSPLHIDSNASVTFPNTTVPVTDAIGMVAAVDNAIVQITPDVAGNVTLSAAKLSDADAAAQIAKQSGTRWKVFYALTPRTGGHATAGKVIDRTAGGSPITELPYVYYTHVPTARERAAQQAERDQAAQQTAAALAQAAQQTAQASGSGTAAANPQAMTPQSMNSYNPYNSGPYNFSPYRNGYYDSNGGYTPPASWDIVLMAQSVPAAA